MITVLLMLAAGLTALAAGDAPPQLDAIKDMGLQCNPEWLSAYSASPFAPLSEDSFTRFSRDPRAVSGPGEVLVDDTWRILLAPDSDAPTQTMARDLAEFLKRAMNISVPVERVSRADLSQRPHNAIVLRDSGGGSPNAPGSYSISVKPGMVAVSGRDSQELRDGVVKLVEGMGLRQLPSLPEGERVYRPRLKMRLGRVPLMGSYRDVAFVGNNAVVMGYTDFYSLSTSDAFPELASLRKPELVELVTRNVEDAHRYGLKAYLHVHTSLFPGDAPVFLAHPEAKGANLDFGVPDRYTLCSEQALVQRFLSESVENLFRRTGLDGLLIIVGGEEFYHCFMRASGKTKGHTNCERCEPLGAEPVVADLLNLLGDAARRFNPSAEVVAWPYSAGWCWSADDAQLGLIRLMKLGTALLTEMEKDETVEKPNGIKKVLWDYSIDLIGPGVRARKQIQACKAAGIPVYLKSDPEHAYEAARLPQIPCMDLWWDRAEAMAASGADGAWVFSYVYRPCYGSSATEIPKFVWWYPAPDKEQTLSRLASRLVGTDAGPHVRSAWKHVSDAISSSPELPPRYFMGPLYLGAAHPMCCDPKAPLPDLYYLGQGERRTPVFDAVPTGDVPVFAKYYRRMEEHLKHAVEEITAGQELVPANCRVLFNAEQAPIRFFYHSARTAANFYESCQLRDRLTTTSEARADTEVAQARWRALLLDERANAAAALPVAEMDVRLDQYSPYAGGAAMIRAKLKLIDQELSDFLPAVAGRSGLAPTASCTP